MLLETAYGAQQLKYENYEDNKDKKEDKREEELSDPQL